MDPRSPNSGEPPSFRKFQICLNSEFPYCPPPLQNLPVFVSFSEFLDEPPDLEISELLPPSQLQKLFDEVRLSVSG